MALVTCNDKAESVVLKAAFRCKSCGHLEHSGHAGDLAVPLACRVCGAGVVWTRGSKKPDPDNWQVLATCTPAELKEFGLKPGDVATHVGKAVAGAGGATHVREVTDKVESKDAAS